MPLGPVFIVLVLLAAGMGIADPGRAAISGGVFTPLYGVETADETLPVGAFLIDRYPVTNREFDRFIDTHPEWKPSGSRNMLRDQSYLKHWEGGRPKAGDLNRPVVFVSWFAAEAFCAARGGRLPTVLEWEYVAAASTTTRDASRDPAFVDQLLKWYSRPGRGTDNLPEVGKGPANVWGVHDMHGVVWEWNADFNSVFVLGDNRRDGEELQDLFCGAGAASGTDKANYAAFMRYAMRNSLKGNYTTANLGFRCAYDGTGEGF